MHGRFHAVFATGLRFIVARSMCGVLDEYRSHGMLVGWSHTVIKGDTLREMWFYQTLPTILNNFKICGNKAPGIAFPHRTHQTRFARFLKTLKCAEGPRSTIA